MRFSAGSKHQREVNHSIQDFVFWLRGSVRWDERDGTRALALEAATSSDGYEEKAQWIARARGSPIMVYIQAVRAGSRWELWKRDGVRGVHLGRSVFLKSGPGVGPSMSPPPPCAYQGSSMPALQVSKLNGAIPIDGFQRLCR